MHSGWNDENITKALKDLPQAPQGGFEADRLWLKLETRILERGKPRWKWGTWRPWGHPVRWVAAAACLFIAFSGILTHQRSLEREDMASYLLSVSNPTEDLEKDPGVVQSSELLTAPLVVSVDWIFEENASDSLAVDDVFL